MSEPLRYLGPDLHSRHLFLLQLRSWNDWPRDLVLPSKHFCLLLAGDAQGVSEETIGRLAETALGAGCVYLCAWGPDCERVHDLFERQSFHRHGADQTPNAAVVMTTWHQNETLDSALTFLASYAIPDEAIVATCRSSVIAVVGNSGWALSVRNHRFG